MSPVPASAITIADGEITLDAELLAPVFIGLQPYQTIKLAAQPAS